MTKKALQRDPARIELVNAMKTLMATESVESITVSQICQTADPSRQTFYRCFLDKYDLINWQFDILLHASFDQMGSGRTIYEGLINKFGFIKQEYLFFHAAFKCDTQNNLKDHDYQMIFDFYKALLRSKGADPLEKQIEVLLDMYCYGSVYLTVKWVMEEMPCSEAKLENTMILAMPEPLRSLFNKLNILDGSQR